MGFIRFWLIWPLSAQLSPSFTLSVFMGPDDTRALVHAIVMDYLRLLFKFIALVGFIGSSGTPLRGRISA